MKFLKNDQVAVFALGGLGDIGKLTYGVHCEEVLIRFAAGILFPEDDLLGS
ncbi:ribonuclease J, partial [Bacillus cereus]|nr:ribonuclease J [Bacillus cereus]